jgi:hypothetical protein
MSQLTKFRKAYKRIKTKFKPELNIYVNESETLLASILEDGSLAIIHQSTDPAFPFENRVYVPTELVEQLSTWLHTLTKE